MAQQTNQRPTVLAWIGIIVLVLVTIVCIVGTFFNDSIILPLLSQLFSIASLVVGIIQINKNAFTPFMPRGKKSLVVRLFVLFCMLVLVINVYSIVHARSTPQRQAPQYGCQLSVNQTGNNNDANVIQCNK